MAKSLDWIKSALTYASAFAVGAVLTYAFLREPRNQQQPREVINYSQHLGDYSTGINAIVNGERVYLKCDGLERRIEAKIGKEQEKLQGKAKPAKKLYEGNKQKEKGEPNKK